MVLLVGNTGTKVTSPVAAELVGGTSCCPVRFAPKWWFAKATEGVKLVDTIIPNVAELCSTFSSDSFFR